MFILPKEILHWLWKWCVDIYFLYLSMFFFSLKIFSLLHACVDHSLILQYQNCLRKFYYNTDSQVLLYLARTHYEAEQWQDCKKTLLRAIHLAPSNYTLRFDAGVAMQKFSASTLQKTKRTADEVNWSNLPLSFFLLFFHLSELINSDFSSFLWNISTCLPNLRHILREVTWITFCLMWYS